MKNLSQPCLACALALVCVAVVAGPAPWFKWRSKLDGKLVCAQTALGSGWEQASGPYRDSRCERLAGAK